MVVLSHISEHPEGWSGSLNHESRVETREGPYAGSKGEVTEWAGSLISKEKRQRFFRFKPNLKLTALALVMFPLLCALGFWQLGRMAEKQKILEQLELQQRLSPVSMEELPDQLEQLRGRRVKITGEFDNDRVILLDNRIMAGHAGYEVLVLFRTASGARNLWLNRGWVAADGNRQRLPEIAPVVGQVTVVGEIYVPYGAAILLGANQAEGRDWPKVVQAAELSMLRVLWGVELYPHQIRLLPEQPGVLQRPWTTVNVTPEKHLGYAVQWFALAAALLLLYLYSSCVVEEEAA